MIEVIVTMVIPATYKVEKSTSGALLARDHVVEDEPTHAEVYRLEFEDHNSAMNWLRDNANQNPTFRIQ